MTADGDLMFLAPNLQNQGMMTAMLGQLLVGVGNQMTLDRLNNNAITLIPQMPNQQGVGLDNPGTIQGSIVNLQADGNLYQTAISIDPSGSVQGTGFLLVVLRLS